MAERRDLAGPEMRRRTGLHADQAAVKLPEKAENSASPQLLLQHDGASGINAVKLEIGRGQIDPECCNLHVDGSFPLLVFDSTSLAHRDAVGVEPSTPSGQRCRTAAIWACSAGIPVAAFASAADGTVPS
jgi:hypothetical protein